MNGIRQIPREPAAKPQATPAKPKEEGKEDYPYRCVPPLPCLLSVSSSASKARGGGLLDGCVALHAAVLLCCVPSCRFGVGVTVTM